MNTPFTYQIRQGFNVIAEGGGTTPDENISRMIAAAVATDSLVRRIASHSVVLTGPGAQNEHALLHFTAIRELLRDRAAWIEAEAEVAAEQKYPGVASRIDLLARAAEQLGASYDARLQAMRRPVVVVQAEAAPETSPSTSQARPARKPPARKAAGSR